MGKTITTYLIDGNPQGVQNIFLSNNICNLTVIPRADLDIVNKRPGLNLPALYILIGEDEINQELKAYIGETENFTERIKEHDYKKTFWQKALVFNSKDTAMTKVDVQYLEHMAVALATKVKKFNITENKQTPKAPNLPEHQQSNIEEFFEDIKLLTSFVGCTIFEMAEKKGKTIFYLKTRKADAQGFYDENGFTVLSDSIISKEVTPSFIGKEKREIWLKNNTTEINNITLVTTDSTFKSPSAASDYCTGSSTNGWDMWKNDKGQTLNEVYRNKLND